MAHRACLSVKAEHASQQAVSGFFCGLYALVFACFASRHASFVFPLGGGGGGLAVTLGMSLHGYEDILPAGGCYSGGGGGFPLSAHTPNLRDVTVASASDASKQCFGVTANTVLNGVPLKQV